VDVWLREADASSSPRVYLSVYLRDHPIEAEAVIIGVGEKSFTVRSSLSWHPPWLPTQSRNPHGIPHGNRLVNNHHPS
jgi:hypothetical protein